MKLFESEWYIVRTSDSLEANYDVVNKVSDKVEARFQALPSGIEASEVLSGKLNEFGFSVAQTEMFDEHGNVATIH